MFSFIDQSLSAASNARCGSAPLPCGGQSQGAFMYHLVINVFRARACAISDPRPSNADVEALAKFRWPLRRCLRCGNPLAHRYGVTPLQYPLLLPRQRDPHRTWAGVEGPATHPQAKHPGVVLLACYARRCGRLQP
jgi:hypothetical protein